MIVRPKHRHDGTLAVLPSAEGLWVECETIPKEVPEDPTLTALGLPAPVKRGRTVTVWFSDEDVTALIPEARAAAIRARSAVDPGTSR